MSRGPDVHTQLERALIAQAKRRGIEATIEAGSMVRWASATFSGARHELALSAPPSSRLEQWLADLPEAEFALAGHLVADLSVEAVQRTPLQVTASLEALTVEER
jgi:hypothetical protein